MQTTKIQQGQTFFDAVIGSTGSITNAFDMALANQISITDVVFNQMDLIVTGVENKAITKLFIVNKPASKDKNSYAILDYILSQTIPLIL